MTRKTWVQDPVTHKLVPKDEYYREQSTAAPYVMGDIKPYQSMITGEMIQGRAQHRAHLRQHGCIEVGNEKLTPTKPSQPSSSEYKRLVADVMASKGY